MGSVMSAQIQDIFFQIPSLTDYMKCTTNLLPKGIVAEGAPSVGNQPLSHDKQSLLK